MEVSSQPGDGDYGDAGMKRSKLEMELHETRALVKCMLRAIENLGFDHYARIDARIYYMRYKKRLARIRKNFS